jgi:hypothetical protein
MPRLKKCKGRSKSPRRKKSKKKSRSRSRSPKRKKCRSRSRSPRRKKYNIQTAEYVRNPYISREKAHTHYSKWLQERNNDWKRKEKVYAERDRLAKQQIAVYCAQLERRENQPIPSNQQPINPVSNQQPINPVSNQQPINPVSNQQPINPVSDTSEKKVKQDDQVLCVICMDNQRNILLDSCHHVCMCNKCYDKLQVKSCPICKKNIDKIIPVYLS